MSSPKIVCIGDSITFGSDVENTQKWTTLLSNEFNIPVINCGVNGDTTAGMLSRFEQLIIKHLPTHIILTGGINDLWFGLKDEQIISNIYTMVQLANYNEVECIIGIPTPFFNLNELNFVQENFSECIRSFKKTLIDYCIDEGFSYIDFSNNLSQDHFLEDGLHPNRKGHKVMLDNAKKKLKILLRE